MHNIMNELLTIKEVNNIYGKRILRICKLDHVKQLRLIEN